MRNKIKTTAHLTAYVREISTPFDDKATKSSNLQFFGSESVMIDKIQKCTYQDREN
jgi:hypothetical protein